MRQENLKHPDNTGDRIERGESFVMGEKIVKENMQSVAIHIKDFIITHIVGLHGNEEQWIGQSIGLVLGEENNAEFPELSNLEKSIKPLQKNESVFIQLKPTKLFPGIYSDRVKVTNLGNKRYEILLFEHKSEILAHVANNLVSQNALLKDMLHLSLVLFRMSDERNECYYFSKQWLSFTGKRIKSELKDEWESFIIAEDLPTVNESLRKAFSKRLKYEFKYRLLRHDDQIRWVFESGIPLFDNDGNYIGFMSVTVDITDIQEPEKTAYENADHFKTLGEQAPVLFRMADTQNEFYYFSKQWLIFTGNSHKDEMNEGWKNGIHNDDYKNVVRTISKALKNRKKYEISYRLRNKKGEFRWVMDTGIPVYSQLGEFSGFISATIDVHESKQSEYIESRKKVLKESEKKLQYSLDHSRFIALSVNENYEITYCNPYFLDLSGKEMNEVVNQPLNKFLELVDTTDDLNSIIHSLFNQTNNLDAFEAIINNKFREKFIIRFSSLTLFGNGETYPTVMFIGENVTERKKIQLALEKSNSQLKDLFDNANDLILIFDPSGKFLFVNQLAKAKLGYSETEIPSLDFESILDPKSVKETFSNLDRISQGVTIHELDTILINKAGDRVFVRGNVNCSFQHGKAKEFRCIFYDVTERIKADKAQNLYYSISNLAINSADLDTLFDNIHMELQKIIPAKNFYIATYDKNADLLKFPFFIDTYSPEFKKHAFRKFKKGLTEYVINTKTPYLLLKKDIQALIKKNEIKLFGELPEIWLGVPLILQGEVAGMIAVQNYKDPNAYTLKDLDLLIFISGQIANAIDRKKKEEKINDQTARIQSIFESGNHMIWSVNKKLSFSSINQSLKEFLNENIQTGSRVKTVYKDIDKFNRTPFWKEKYKMAFQGKPVQFECSFTNTNTQEISWKNILLNPILLKNGKIEEVSGIAYDITENKNSELALAKSEEKFRDIFESFQDVYFRCDFKGNIIMLSPSVQDLLGYNPVHLIGKDITNYFLYSKKSKGFLREIVRQRSIRNFEASVVDKKGSIIQCLCNIRLVYDNSVNAIALEGVARDITKLKETNLELKQAKEVAEKSLKVKELFLANMSHEIRTPMNGIIGMIDLLHGTMITEEQKHFTDTIKRSSETLLNILNDILDLSKIEAGKMQLKREPVKFKNALDKIYALFSQQSLAKNINLYYHLSENLPEYVLIDETRLLQILSNLISNAIKFTEGGGSIDIDLKRAKIPGKKHMVRCVVSDSGIGISPNNLNQLFGIFSQVDNTSTKSYGGTGLGLAISKELCRLMGGKIGVYSTLGLGSSFWFTFEAEPTDKTILVENKLIESDIKIEGYFKDETPRILLVDDNGVNRQVASEILKKSGCIVELAEDGKQAIDAVIKNEYDLIFMDIQMPEMDGVTATRHIKKLNIKKLPPIVAMTAYSMKEDRDRFLSQGLDDYIAKPIRANDLLNKVRQWIKDEVIIDQNGLSNKELGGEIINMETVNQLMKMGGEEMVQEVFKDFIIESTEQINDAYNASTENDLIEIQKNLHTLKGNAGTLGVEKLSKQAEVIEKNIKNGNFDSMEKDLEFLKLAFEEFESRYNQLINKT